MGTVSSVFGLKLVRLGLGLSEGLARWGWLPP